MVPGVRLAVTANEEFFEVPVDVSYPLRVVKKSFGEFDESVTAGTLAEEGAETALVNWLIF